jgi:Protein of unknown function (DUF732)
MKFKKAIAGSLLGVAVGVGVFTAGTGTAQADAASYLDVLASEGYEGSLLDLGLDVCAEAAAGATQQELIDWVYSDRTDETIDWAEARYIVESAEIYLC